MLLLLTALAMSPPQAVEFTGMPPQLKMIRDAAGQRDWKISCEGHSGEEGVIRIAVPAGTGAGDIDSFVAALNNVASSSAPLSADEARQANCDREPSISSADSQAFALMSGAQDELEKLLDLTKECGFSKAHVRPWQERDGPAPSGSQHWYTLDAGEDLVPRYGPTICFVNLVQAPLMKSNADSSPHR